MRLRRSCCSRDHVIYARITTRGSSGQLVMALGTSSLARLTWNLQIRVCSLCGVRPSPPRPHQRSQAQLKLSGPTFLTEYCAINIRTTVPQASVWLISSQCCWCVLRHFFLRHYFVARFGLISAHLNRLATIASASRRLASAATDAGSARRQGQVMVRPRYALPRCQRHVLPVSTCYTPHSAVALVTVTAQSVCFEQAWKRTR